MVGQPSHHAGQEAERDILRVVAVTRVLDAAQPPVDEGVEVALFRRRPDVDGGVGHPCRRRGSGLAVNPHLNGSPLGVLVGDGRVGVDADAADVDVGLVSARARAHHVVQQVNSIHWQSVGDRALRQRDRPLLHSPQIYPLVGPRNKQKVKTTSSSAQVIAGADFYPAHLIRLFANVEYRHPECSCACGRHLNCAVFLAMPLGCLTNCLPALVPSRLALVVAAYSEDVSASRAFLGR